MKTRTPAQSEQFRKTCFWVFGLTFAAFEIVVRHGAEPAVFVFLAMVLGFKPAVHLDHLFGGKPEQPAPQTPAPEAAKEAATP